MYAYLREIESKYTVQDDYLKGFVTTGIKVFSTGIPRIFPLSNRISVLYYRYTGV